jgi:hypothetical protein
VPANAAVFDQHRNIVVPAAAVDHPGGENRVRAAGEITILVHPTSHVTAGQDCRWAKTTGFRSGGLDYRLGNPI